MGKVHDFKKSIVVGDYGEKIIKEYLQSNPRIVEVEDVSNIPRYQNRDIDLIVQFDDGRAAAIEIKTDTYTSGNIFFETMSNVEHNVVGCMYKTKADYLFYYFTETRELYILNMDKYRAWFEANKSHFKRKQFKNVNRQRNGTYTSVGYTIPKVFLEENFRHKKVILQNQSADENWRFLF